MASRSFKYYTLQTTNVPQPLFGSWVAAGAGPSTTAINIQVGDSSQFQVGDMGFFQNVTGTVASQERQLVTAVPDGTHITVAALSQARTGGVIGTGDYVSIQRKVYSFYVQTKDGNTASAYVGDAPTTRNTGVNCIAQLTKVTAGSQPVDFSSILQGLANTIDISQYFIVGTNPDQYLPSFYTLGTQ